MLINTESNVLASAGLKDTSQFQIATNAHAFRILSSGVYSDKIQAVIREIGCNAADAHIAAGTPGLPFEVHLPSRLYSKFYIRDFGPGLDHEEVLSLYTTYFSSSKQQSNDFTGAFGLGSKSPFSYTDSFNIVSVKDGIKRTYAAYVGQTGSPQVSKIDEQVASDDWQHGMMISMAVKPTDYAEFQQKAQNVFKWFRTTPKMLNGAQIQPVTYKVKQATYGQVEANGDNVLVRIVMGNVSYPVPLSEVGQGNEWWVGIMRPVLFVNIGDVDVAVSREHLEFTDKTRQSIKTALATVFKDYCGKIVDELTPLDLTTYAGLENAWQYLRQHGQQWGGHIGTVLKKGGMLQARADMLEDLASYSRRPRMPKDWSGHLRLLVRRNDRPRLEKMFLDGALHHRISIPADFGEKSAIVLTEDTRYVNDRIRWAVGDRKYDTLILVGENDAEALATAKAWYDYPTVKASDLELPPAWVRPSERRKNKPVSRKKWLDTAECTFASFDRSTGECKVALARIVDLSPTEKFYATSTVGWGKFTYHFGTQTSRDFGDGVRALAAASMYIPELPDGVALLKQGDITRGKLLDNGFVLAADKVESVIKDPNVIARVGNAPRGELPALHYDDTCYEHNGVRLLAAYAHANKPLWQELESRIKDLKLYELVKALVSKHQPVTQANAEIPLDVFNKACDSFGFWRLKVERNTVASPIRKYPTLDAFAASYLNNRIIGASVSLSADLIARLAAFDEKVPTINTFLLAA